MKKKNMIAVMICAITLVLAGCGTLTTASFSLTGLIKNIFGEKEKGVEYPLTKYNRYCGGGMNGGSDDVSVKLLKDGRVLCTYFEQEWYNSPAVVKEYFLDEKVLSDIKDVFDEYKMKKWPDLRDSDDFALDAPTESWHFMFGDYDESVSFNEYKKFPKNAYDGLKKINDIIDSYAKKADKLPALLNDPDMTDDDYLERFWVKDGKVELFISTYYDMSLNFVILNGSEEDIDIEDAPKLYLVDKKDIPVEFEEDYYGIATAGYEYNDSLRFNEPLKAGKYRLEIADLSCNFEIK